MMKNQLAIENLLPQVLLPLAKKERVKKGCNFLLLLVQNSTLQTLGDAGAGI